MKKWLVSLALAIVCVFALTACGSSSSASDDTLKLTAAQQQEGVSYVKSLQKQEDTDAESIRDEVAKAALESWQNSKEDIGTVESIDPGTVTLTDDDGIVTVEVKGSSHDAEVMISLTKENEQYKTTAVAVNVEYSFGEKMSQAGLNTLLGMGTTFVVLIILIIVVSLSGRIIGSFENRGKKKAAEAAPAPAPAPVVEEDEEEEEEDETDNEALVAVIAAAVAAFEGKKTTKGFVVRSIRKSRKKF